MSTVIMNSTEVRRNFFTILNRVVNDGVEVIVQNKNLISNVRLSIDKPAVIKRSTDTRIIDELKGSLKSKIPYNPNETELAHELYAKDSFSRK